MTEVSFYHLESIGLELALPRLIEKALAQGLQTLVIAETEERVASLNSALWTYDPNSFLPHGSAEDGPANEQPVYLTTHDENPNGAEMVVIVDGASISDLTPFRRVLDLFDGKDLEAVKAARKRWSMFKEAGHSLTYWRQMPDGSWSKKAPK